jgi:LysM repeat protein
MRIKLFAAAALVALALVVGLGAATPVAADAPMAPHAVVYHVVRPGEYVLSIARLYGVSAQSIISANNLRYPYRIYPRQVLVIPTATPPPPPGGFVIHVVRAGDTLINIGRQYGVPWGDIAVANNLSFPFTIYIGQQIRVPRAGGPTPPPPGACITITTPGTNALVTSPVHVSGWGRASQHNELTVRILNQQGVMVGQVNASIQAELGQPGPYSVNVPFTIPVGTQTGWVQVIDYSPRDGSVVCQTSVLVRLRR